MTPATSGTPDRDHQSRLQAILDALFDPHLVVDAVRDGTGQVCDFVIADANAAACEGVDTPREQLVGRHLFDLAPPESAPALFDMCLNVMATGTPLALDNVPYHYAVTGRDRLIELRATRIPGGLSVTWRDVTERQQAAADLAESEERYRLLAENSSEVVVHSRGGVPVWVSPSLTDTLGWDREEWIGTKIDEFVHPDDLEAVVAARARSTFAHLRLRVRTQDGSYHWVEATVRPYVDSHGRQDGGVSTFRLVDHLVEVEQALTREATTDALTGLVNRRQAMSELARRLDPVARTPLAVAFCDLDDFKFINDTYGHMAGDHMLQAVATRASAVVGRDDLVARIGGDEVLIMLAGVTDPVRAKATMSAICAVLAQPVEFEGLELTTTVSVGVALAAPGDDVDDVIARADQAMYRAKRGGRNMVVLAPG